jgi:hypothetical protein
MMVPERRKETKLVMMKESRVPAPATPASVGVERGTEEQFAVAIVVRVLLKKADDGSGRNARRNHARMFRKRLWCGNEFEVVQVRSAMQDQQAQPLYVIISKVSHPSVLI